MLLLKLIHLVKGYRSSQFKSLRKTDIAFTWKIMMRSCYNLTHAMLAVVTCGNLSPDLKVKYQLEQGAFWQHLNYELSFLYIYTYIYIHTYIYYIYVCICWRLKVKVMLHCFNLNIITLNFFNLFILCLLQWDNRIELHNHESLSYPGDLMCVFCCFCCLYKNISQRALYLRCLIACTKSVFHRWFSVTIYYQLKQHLVLI